MHIAYLNKWPSLGQLKDLVAATATTGMCYSNLEAEAISRLTAGYTGGRGNAILPDCYRKGRVRYRGRHSGRVRRRRNQWK